GPAVRAQKCSSCALLQVHFAAGVLNLSRAPRTAFSRQKYLSVFERVFLGSRKPAGFLPRGYSPLDPRIVTSPTLSPDERCRWACSAGTCARVKPQSRQEPPGGNRLTGSGGAPPLSAAAGLSAGTCARFKPQSE